MIKASCECWWSWLNTQEYFSEPLPELYELHKCVCVWLHRGIDVLHKKPELQREMERRRTQQKKKEFEEEQKNKRTSFEKTLEQQANKLKSVSNQAHYIFSVTIK